MEVILLERVEKLGGIGDVVNVKNGFARNYLLPNKKALRANEANRKVFEANRERLEAENAARRDEAAKAGANVDGTELVLIRSASNSGQLYGSVNVRDIADALKGQGHDVNKSQIILERPIKSIGVHDIKVALHPEVAVTVHVNVARSPEEAELQAQGIDVIAQMFEEEAAPVAAEQLQAETAEPEAEAEATEVAAEEPAAEAEPEAAAEAQPETAGEGEAEQQ